MDQTGQTRIERIRSEIDRVLWEVWDPIGVNDVPQARDEYTSYVGGVCELLLARRPDAEIAASLNEISEKAMGLGRDATVPATIGALLRITLE